ncbi:MAG: CPBP family intramembrane metalloprotease [bacterium]|nr:CPBP family intramembrane metalloprotease [bacterium]
MANKISSTQRTLNLWAIVLIIWSVYRANVVMPEWFDEFIAKPAVFILPVYYYITQIEKKNFLAGLLIKPKQFISDLLLGLGIGGIFIITALFANFVKFNKVFLTSNAYDSKGIILMIAIALATGITEEILSRGFVLKRLYEESKNKFTASFFSSILFFFLHVPMLFTNARITGNLLLLFMATDLILSLVTSFLFLERKSLGLPILVHAFYNLALVMFI